jgi:hypothetical protein
MVFQKVIMTVIRSRLVFRIVGQLAHSWGQRIKNHIPAHIMNTSINKQPKSSGCKVWTSIRAGGSMLNHNQTVVPHEAAAHGLEVKSHVKAGGPRLNHNSTVAGALR